ncbi:hypothetical protein [Burkholderia multivorans]|uniref:hypothetical protein n=2 Tax=Burkholderia multivorans TaxID=87883 RepID=UPI001F1FC24E|nr:hypothetical protein [Burkholderia multivorans]MDN8031263.1 hypothetical protein [Burkholderia multivorans]
MQRLLRVLEDAVQRTPRVVIASAWRVMSSTIMNCGIASTPRAVTRLMGYCEKEAQARGVPFERFALRDMRPAAVTDWQEEGDDRIIDATGHADERMVRKTYDRRRERRVRATR